MEECERVESCLRKRNEALSHPLGSPLAWDTHCVNCALGLKRRMDKWIPDSDIVIRVENGSYSCVDCNKPFKEKNSKFQKRCLPCYRIFQTRNTVSSPKKCIFCGGPLGRNRNTKYMRCDKCYREHQKSGYDLIVRGKGPKNESDSKLSRNRPSISRIKSKTRGVFQEGKSQSTG